MVLYFGDPRGALALLARGVPLVGVVHGRRGGPGRQALTPRIAHLPRWTLPDLEDPEIVSALRALAPRLIVAAFYPRRIPADVLALAPGLNVHPSPLPRFRGPDPCAWSIRAGDAETQVCVQWLALGLDEGDVLRRTPMATKPRDTAGTLAERCEALGATLIADVAVEVLAGRTPRAEAQVGEVVWAPLLAPNDAEIDWTRPAEEVDRFVRAASPHPGAFTGIGDETVGVLAASPAEAGRFDALPSGTPFVRGGEAFVKCGQGALRLDRVRLGTQTLTAARFAELLV